MKETVFIPGRLTESNTLYRADRALYDVRESDCAEVLNSWCLRYCNALPKSHSAVYAEDLKNIGIDFGGATLRLNGLLQPITLLRCESVRISNVNIEYNRGIFSEATVLEVGEDYARVHFSDEFPCRVEDGRLIPYCAEWEDDHLFERQMFFQFFDAETGDGLGLSLGIVGPQLPEGMDLCFHPTQYIAEEADGDVIFRPAKAGEKMRDLWRPGRLLAIEHGGRYFPGILLHSCKNVTLENVRLINTNSMGVMPLHCENLYIRGLRLIRDEKSHGLLTNSADAVHGIANSGDFVMEDCVLENMMDDALNVHGMFQLVSACEGNKLTVRLMAPDVTQYSNPADVGDEIAVYEENTMVPRSTHRIVAKTILNDSTAELTLDTAPEGVRVDDLVENLTGNCRLTLRRCRFAKANTHLRFQTRGRVLVEDCVTELPFWFTGDTTFWFESSPCQDVTIRNTYFVKPRAIVRSCPEVRACDAEPYYHKHIRVENCMFVSETPMKLRYTDDVHFRANRQISGQKMKIELFNCGSLDAPGCDAERTEGEQVLKMN